MSARRPRIKAIANIGVKRKIKGDSIEKPNKEIKREEIEPNDDDVISDEKSSSKTVEDAKPTTNIATSDTHSVRPRQRIKATPFFDVRRNSLHGPNPLESEVPEISQIKEPKPPPIPTQNFGRPLNVNRTRTESLTLPAHQNTTTATAISDYHHCPPPRENIPPRLRKFSTMEDPHRLSTARKDFNSKSNRGGKTPEKSILKMYEFIYYNPSSNPMKFDEKCSSSRRKSNEFTVKPDKDFESSEISNEETPTILDSETNETVNSLPVPQVKLGPNGEIIIDERSLVIETTAEKQVRSNLAASKNFIYLDEYSGNNGFYSRQKRTRDWTAAETIKFYRCLHTVGTDFSLMLTLFPDRSRRDLKLKFKKEEKLNGSLVNKAILHPKEFDIEELKREFEHESEMNKKKNLQEDKEIGKLAITVDPNHDSKLFNKSKSSRVLTKGELAYQHEDLLQKKSRKRREKKKKPKDIDDSISKDNLKIDSHEHNTEVVGSKANNEVEITDIDEIFSFGDLIPELKGSSLALVSSIDDSGSQDGSGNKMSHEIFIVCKETKVLSKQPLDLPKEVIDRILMVMGKYDD